MGAVYKVLDTKLDRVAALKVVHSHLSSDADFVERFRDEARKTARLQGHPNIVQIFDVANDHGTEYLVMEYFPSTNLRDQLRSQGKFPLRDAINVTRQIAQALMKSHSCDIIHRDIKPANILLDSNQFVKLTDFGIAKALSDAPLTSTGQLIGTLKYMSPEQARNTILDGKTDLYSLGMVLHELVTGKNLWKDVPNLAIYGNLQAEATIPPLVFSSEVPQGIQSVIQDLLRFDPTDRIQNAEALIARLEDLREIWEDPDATIVKPRMQEPEVLEDDQTVAVLHPPSSGPSGQKPSKPQEKLQKSPPKLPQKPRKIAIEGIPNPSDPIESNTTKTIRNSIIAAIALLVIGSFYYFGSQPSTVVTDVKPKTKTIPKVLEVRKESQPLTTEEIEVTPINKTQSAASKARVVRDKAEENRIAAEKKARLAQAEAEVEAKSAEKARKEQAQAEAEAQAAEAARIAQAQAAEKAQAAEQARLAQAKLVADAQAAEEARVAEAKAAEAAKAKEEERKAQEKAAEKARAAEQARLTKSNAEAKARAAEEARIAQAEAVAKAQAAEQARIAEAEAAAKAQAAEKARAAQAEAAAEAQAAEKARIAKAEAAAKAQAAEKARAAQAKADAQAKAVEEARAAQAKADAQAKAAEEARAAEAKAAAQVKAADEAQAAAAKAAAQAKAAEKNRIAQANAAAQAAQTQALNTLLTKLQRSIAERDLKALQSISTMSASREKMLNNLFARYETIETSIGDVNRNDDKATVILQFTKFVRPNGEIVQPSRFLKTTNVVIPKDGNGWGLLNW